MPLPQMKPSCHSPNRGSNYLAESRSTRLISASEEGSVKLPSGHEQISISVAR